MKTKSEVFKNDQELIRNKIVSILDLENIKKYTLYELDNNKEIHNKIMELIPEIRKYFSYNGIKAVGEPERIKRPYLSIIKHLLKPKYNIITTEVRINREGKEIRTMEYNFEKLI